MYTTNNNMFCGPRVSVRARNFIRLITESRGGNVPKTRARKYSKHHTTYTHTHTHIHRDQITYLCHHNSKRTIFMYSTSARTTVILYCYDISPDYTVRDFFFLSYDCDYFLFFSFSFSKSNRFFFSCFYLRTI